MSNTNRQAWTDHDKLSFLINIIQNGAISGDGVDWKKVPVPPGRTLKACQLMYFKLKTQVKETDADAGDDDLNQPKEQAEKKAATPKKRNKSQKTAVNGDDSPSKKRKVKAEEPA